MTTIETHEINGTQIETVVDESTGLATLTFTRIFDATPELMFECLTTPEHLTRFWGPDGVSTPIEHITVDLRVGGVFETVMVNDETGEQYPSKGVYTVIDPPHRLAFAEDLGETTFSSTMTFEDLGDGRTRSVTVQENVPAMFRSSDALQGMTSSFRRMDAYLAGLAAA